MSLIKMLILVQILFAIQFSLFKNLVVRAKKFRKLQQFHVISLLITSVCKEYEPKDAHILIPVPPAESVQP